MGSGNTWPMSRLEFWNKNRNSKWTRTPVWRNYVNSSIIRQLRCCLRVNEKGMIIDDQLRLSNRWQAELSLAFDTFVCGWFLTWRHGCILVLSFLSRTDHILIAPLECACLLAWDVRTDLDDEDVSAAAANLRPPVTNRRQNNSFMLTSDDDGFRKNIILLSVTKCVFVNIAEHSHNAASAQPFTYQPLKDST